MTKAAAAAGCRVEVLHHFKVYLNDRHHDELCDALAWLQGEGLLTAVPAGDHKLALIVRIDESHEIAEHDAVTVAESRTWQNDGGQPRIGQIDGKPGGNELRLPGGELERRIKARPKVKACGA
jgi:hypothetical protein